LVRIPRSVLDQERVEFHIKGGNKGRIGGDVFQFLLCSCVDLVCVYVQESRSGIDRVMLTDLTFATSGSYRCEVSTEAPNFDTIFRNHNMTVLGI
jgi:hypothetical protein